MAFVDKGIYLVKNEKIFQKNVWDGRMYVPGPWEFKTKNTHPIICLCVVEKQGIWYANPLQDAARMYTLNPDSQFANKTNKAPRQSLSNTSEFKEEDFQLLGQQEGDIVRHWGTVVGATEIFKKWEAFAIEKKLYTPEPNPKYKTKAEKQRTTAEDFFSNVVRIGDKVAYVDLSGHRKITVGFVTNITDRSIVIDSHYAAPYKYVIKCPEGF